MSTREAMATPMDRLVEQVCRTLGTHRLMARNERVLVAVSGGVDSVVLLDVLRRLASQRGWRLSVGHVNHQLRDEAAADAAFVQRLAQDARLPVAIVERDVRAACRAHGWSLEDGARRVRYEALLSMARSHGASIVAIAHTADDQAETVLLRFLRGAGTQGLSGMPIRRPLAEDVRIVRPLLEVWRQDVEAYLSAAGLHRRQDPTNTDRRFLRNRIRHDLLPLLETTYNPRMKAALVQLADQNRCDGAYLAQALERCWRRLTKRGAVGQVVMARGLLAKQPEALRRLAVRRAIREVQGHLTGFEFRHWREIAGLLNGRPDGTVVNLPGGTRFVRHGDEIVCEQVQDK